MTNRTKHHCIWMEPILMLINKTWTFLSLISIIFLSCILILPLSLKGNLSHLTCISQCSNTSNLGGQRHRGGDLICTQPLNNTACSTGDIFMWIRRRVRPGFYCDSNPHLKQADSKSDTLSNLATETQGSNTNANCLRKEHSSGDWCLLRTTLPTSPFEPFNELDYDWLIDYA